MKRNSSFLGIAVACAICFTSANIFAADLLVHFDFANGSLANKGTLGGTGVLNEGTVTTPTVTEYAPGLYAYNANAANFMGTPPTGTTPTGQDGSLSLSVGTQLNNLKSFTITGWYQTSSGNTAGNNSFLVDMVGTAYLLVGNRLGSMLYFDDSTNQSGQSSASSDIQLSQQWVFFSFSYDSTITEGSNAQFLVGLEPDNLAFQSRLLIAKPLADGSGYISVGNRRTQGDRAFKGMIRDVRIYGSNEDGSGALSADFIREQVMVPEASTYALVAGTASLLAVACLRKRMASRK